MYALLAYRRPNPDVPLGFDVGFELRQMTCFNGLNVSNAFRTVTPIRTQNLKLMLVGGQESAAFYDGNGPADDQNRPWEFIALGWLSDYVPSKGTYTSFYGSRGSFRSLEWMGQILNREHVTGTYRDWNADRSVPGLRDRTPNEVFLGQILSNLQNSTSGSWSDGFETNPVAWAFQARKSFHYSLYDFVGSERPSGLAVAYLQVYRNVSRAMFDTSEAQKRLVNQTRDLCMRLDSTLSKATYQSFVPILSAMINSGSDSDIFSFASASALPLQIMKHGTFSISEFMDNPAPMSREGRYVKGNQSSGLAEKIRVAVQRSGQNVPDIGLSRLGSMRQTLANFSAYCDTSRITDYGVENFISGIQQGFNTLRQLPNIQSMPTEIRAAINTFVDLRQPPTPAVRTAGAASGFLQWAEQNAALTETVH